MIGTVTKYDPLTRTGMIESNDKFYIIRCNSFRRGVRLAEGMAVSFSFSVLSAGPTALQIFPVKKS